MSVYKEGFYCLQQIENQSKRIYEDACDFGALTNKNDSIWNCSKQLVEWYGEKETRKVEKYLTGCTVTQEVTLMDEWNTGDKFTYRLTFVTNNNGIKVKGNKFNGYVYVELLKTVKGNKNMDY